MYEVKRLTKEKFDADMQWVLKDCTYWLGTDTAFTSTNNLLIHVVANRNRNTANPKVKTDRNQPSLGQRKSFGQEPNRYTDNDDEIPF